MNKIKFLSNYPKLWKQGKAILLKIETVMSYEIKTIKELIEYDTKNSRGEYYKLPDGKLIHLTFLGNKLIPFCTIRRYTPQKLDYYLKLIGKEFDIEIK